MSGPRILAWDIEVSPMKVYSWSLWPKFIPIDMIIEPQRVICFTAKWLGEPQIIFRSTFHNGREKMLLAARDLLHEADAVVSWNGKAFDTLHMNRELALTGIPTYSPYKEIDLMRAAKKSMKFASNKLDHVAQELGFPGKLTTTFDLWVRCEAGERKAWNEMRRYNKQDVVLLESIHDRLLPWIPNYPNVALYHEPEFDVDGLEMDRCPACGGTRLAREGYAYLQVGVYQRYRCKDCGKWSRAGRRVHGVSLRAVA